MKTKRIRCLSGGVMVVLIMLMCVTPYFASAASYPCHCQPATIVGTPGDDVIVGTPGDDVISGLGGNDIIYGLGGNDIICGGAGDDIIYGGDGDDIVDGGDGNDRVYGDAGDDKVVGAGGDDTLHGGDGDDVLIGGDGDDTLNGDAGGDILHGDGGNDTLNGGDGDDILNGGVGDDTLNGGAGQDKLNGSSGNDTLDGGDGTDVLNGGDGNDTLWGESNSDTLNGAVGDDFLYGGAGDDVLHGGPGDDYLDGGSGTDVVQGGPGNNTIAVVKVDGADPANGDFDVPVNKTITVTFVTYNGEDVQTGPNYAGITLKDSFGNAVAFTPNVSGSVLTINPDSDLGCSVTYTVIVPAGAVTDTAGNQLSADCNFSFATEAAATPDITPPTVSGTDPTNNATGVPVNKTITVTFSEDVQAGSSYGGITLKDSLGNTVAFSKSVSGKVLAIDPANNLGYNATYTVNIPAVAVKDVAGNPLITACGFSFTTQASGGGGGGGAADNTPPTVDKTDPSDGAKNVPVNKKIKVNFSERIVEGTTFGGITLKTQAGASVSITGKKIEGESLTLEHDNMANSTAYVVYIPAAAVKDTAGNALAQDYAFGFSTQTFTPAPIPSFQDMEGHWAKETVDDLVYRGIISGYPDGAFRPDQPVTRLEAVCVLARALKVTPGEEQDLQKFRDAANIPAWALGDAAGAVREGLVGGCPHPDGSLTFEPAKLITRTEEAAILARVLEKKLGPVAPAPLTFSDAKDIPAWAERSVGIAVAKGVVGGYSDNTFRPKNHVTRAEMASMVWRLLKLEAQ